MDFAFTEEQAMIAETVRAFFAEQATSERTRAAMAIDGCDHDLWRAFSTELGLAGVTLPEAFGGAGLGMVEQAIIAEAAGAEVAALPLLGQAMVARAILAGGSDEQKARLLPRLAVGERVAIFAEAAPDAVWIDGALTGAALHVPHGAIADLFLVAVGEAAVLVERDAPGLAVTRYTSMDQTRPYARLDFGGVSAEGLADPAAALAAAHEAGLVCLAAEALGGAEATLKRTVAYAMERVQFGRPIGSFQAYKHRLADMMIEIEQARSAVYWAACAVDEGAEEASLALPAAKAFCADTFFMCAGNMIQLHGGIGFTWEHDAHLFFKRARSIQTLLGNGDVHRETIAARILGEAA